MSLALGRASTNPLLVDNEEKVCDAIIRHLEAREHHQRSGVRSPDKERHVAPVEFVFHLGEQLYAIEHTRIEPFEGRFRMEGISGWAYRPIERQLDQLLDPASWFELHLPLGAFDRLKRAQIEQIQHVLIAWVKNVANTLPVLPYAERRGGLVRQADASVPCSVRLLRFDAMGRKGGFGVKHVVQGDIEELRAKRIETACEGKFWKLADWKRDAGARTILVLEDLDFQLTNQWLVAQAVVPIARARDDRPDEIYLVSTYVDAWQCWPMLVDELDHSELEERTRPGRFGWYVDPAGLSSPLQLGGSSSYTAVRVPGGQSRSGPTQILP